MSVLQLQNVTLDFAGQRLLDDVTFSVKHQDRIALVGRNGAGKSTLFRLLNGEIHADAGEVQTITGLKIASLCQDVPEHDPRTIQEVLESQMPDNYEAWDKEVQIERMATKLGIQREGHIHELSGGMRRRVLLAATLLSQADVLLLDEPTNHLDVPSIEWLEGFLKAWHGTAIIITHDRAFLNRVCKKIVEIERGKLYQYDGNYELFIQRREQRFADEEQQNALFDKRLSDEETWIRTGIKARRTRNEGRVRALKKMREEYALRKQKVGKMDANKLDTSMSGQLILEANHLSYSISNKQIINDFSLLLMRGDKVGIIGPNGCGKTTLIRLLMNELTPQQGTLRLGTKLDIAFFDQLRQTLNDNDTLMQAVGEGSDFVTVNQQKQHVASYLGSFLFKPQQYNQQVGGLSGGERNRLLLAKLFAKPVNFLIMDEPTNDLDLETLELLECMLVEYRGTLMVISHDREFLNRVVTSVLVYEGDGTFNEYTGGFSDYMEIKKPVITTTKQSTDSPTLKPKSANKLSYKEQRELSLLPQKIEQYEKSIAALHEQMSQPDFYKKNEQEISDFNKKLKSLEDELETCFKQWEALEAKQ